MKYILATFLVALSILSTGTQALALDRPAFTNQPTLGTVMVRDSDYGLFIHRQEVATDGKMTAFDFVMDNETHPTRWVLDKNKTYSSLPSVSADTVARLSNPKWFTEEEKAQYADAIKPKVIVNDKPGCDAAESTLKLLNKQTGTFVPLYKYTAECGEVEFIEFDDNRYASALVMIFRLTDYIKDLGK